MVELVDTLVSGTSDRKVVQVRVLFWVQKAADFAAFLFPLTEMINSEIKRKIWRTCFLSGR